MPRVQLINAAETTANRQVLLAQIQQAFGATPNMFKAVANSPAALTSMWGSFAALGAGVLGAKLGEQIAVAIANQNRCEYCLAAHTVLGKNAGVSADELRAAQAGQSSDPKTAAALAFALKVVKNRAQVSNQDISELRAVGFDDEHIVEILAHIALNIFTNYVNVAFEVPVDFPLVALNPID
ncbi:carboxymuconolactone decarboxylase family protein [Deefgea piscis]|uniref:Carboxymuconolactone decarboxylase family protein n=1 Tax=Deefgea piscis TaxID=2739061 RepID=A0A6M8SMW8_9NEIS|nr:carboxymuconolactone decarboxylase family protein [Deefgea piscis]QKJ66572.1 carboxymuconolactone decarboxylase family protein [Deefgea piscis]